MSQLINFVLPLFTFTVTFFRNKYLVLSLGIFIGGLAVSSIFYFTGFLKNKTLKSSEHISIQKQDHKKQSNDLSSGTQDSNDESEKDNGSKIYFKPGSANKSMGSQITLKDEEISVLKEELVSIRNVKVRCENDPSLNKSDSLIAELSGVHSRSGDYMMIEFWKTPLNSKGYKMSRNKLLLYGAVSENQDVFKLNNRLYLKNDFGVFKLEYSNEFRKLENVTESAILARLN